MSEAPSPRPEDERALIRYGAAHQDESSFDTAAAIDLLGDRWALHVLRAVARGHRRFGEMRRFTGAASNILAGRLERLVEHGLLRRTAYSGGATPRYEYELAPAGADAMIIIEAFRTWARRPAPAGATPDDSAVRRATGAARTPATQEMAAVDPDVRRRVSHLI
ncbi:helix-turn-helix domain-containing protein [Microbacterium sp. ProA8]|jgi:DNA-binding HxlR family transcriptional regulator|uniref:winged helix-turn-helix transcriptional regulator n=1 Tax=Microbacterium chionoecetis TaxID=3153754 RepID=UPI003265F0D9